MSVSPYPRETARSVRGQGGGSTRLATEVQPVFWQKQQEELSECNDFKQTNKMDKNRTTSSC